MSVESLLIHRVEVYRRAESSPGVRAVDRFGQERSINPRQHSVGGEALVATYPARAWQPSGGLAMNERMVDTFERVYAMYTGLDVDIREDDAVRVLDGNGHEIFGLAKIKSSEIKYDSNGPHHCEFTIWQQSGPQEVA